MGREWYFVSKGKAEVEGVKGAQEGIEMLKCVLVRCQKLTSDQVPLNFLCLYQPPLTCFPFLGLMHLQR